MSKWLERIGGLISETHASYRLKLYLLLTFIIILYNYYNFDHLHLFGVEAQTL